jgi:asparagine synthase (glutamine-hydrolysing)
LSRLQYLDFHTYLPDDILTKVDRATMAVSLEARVPLLSRRIVEFAFRLDERTRYLNGQLKGLFKHAFRDRLPSSILERSKKGFSIPPAYYKSDELAEHEVLLRDIYEIK